MDNFCWRCRGKVGKELVWSQLDSWSWLQFGLHRLQSSLASGRIVARGRGGRFGLRSGRSILAGLHAGQELLNVLGGAALGFILGGLVKPLGFALLALISVPSPDITFPVWLFVGVVGIGVPLSPALAPIESLTGGRRIILAIMTSGPRRLV
jgi:hypothetical protein